MSGGSKQRILVIVPAYNEAANLPKVIGDLRQHCPDYDVVVVDDGSPDETATTARSLGVVVLQLPVNLGIGGAVQTGLLYGVRHGYDVCVQVDGDGQHDARETAKLVGVLNETSADAVVGSRFLGSGGFQSTAFRRIGIRALRYVISLLTGQYISDPTSGQRAFGARAIALLAKDYPQEYPEPEVVYLLARSSLRITEVPVQMKGRQSGRSSIGMLDSVLYMVKVLLSLFVHELRVARKEPTP